MTGGSPPEGLQGQISRLEALAGKLEADGLSPGQIKVLADEALEIAQRVSSLLADARDAGPPPGDSTPGAAS